MRIALKFTGDVADERFVPGVPAQDVELDDGDDSEDRYAAQIAENTQHQPPILLTRRICERLILWGAEEEREGVGIAERLALQLTATGHYSREIEATDEPREVVEVPLGESAVIEAGIEALDTGKDE